MMVWGLIKKSWIKFNSLFKHLIKMILILEEYTLVYIIAAKLAKLLMKTKNQTSNQNKEKEQLLVLMFTKILTNPF